MGKEPPVLVFILGSVTPETRRLSSIFIFNRNPNPHLDPTPRNRRNLNPKPWNRRLRDQGPGR